MNCPVQSGLSFVSAIAMNAAMSHQATAPSPSPSPSYIMDHELALFPASFTPSSSHHLFTRPAIPVQTAADKQPPVVAQQSSSREASPDTMMPNPSSSKPARRRFLSGGMEPASETSPNKKRLNRETHEEKAANRLKSHADPTHAMNEDQPCKGGPSIAFCFFFVRCPPF